MDSNGSGRGADLMADLDKVYWTRFPEAAEASKDRIWREIVAYLERWIDPAAPVLDILPYSTAGRLPADPRLVRAYLRMPVLWRIMGRQTLLVAEPR